jgi:pilus assembly protein TadC
MAIKTKKKSAQHNEWKNLSQGFVENVFEKLSDNVSQKIRSWVVMLKRKTAGFILTVLGVLYLLIGLSVFLNSILGPILPGLGYVTVGVLAILIGYLTASTEV